MYTVSFVYLDPCPPPLTTLVDRQFPLAWVLLLFVGILKFNISFLPIVMLALVFNVTNTVGYTYGERAGAGQASSPTSAEQRTDGPPVFSAVRCGSQYPHEPRQLACESLTDLAFFPSLYRTATRSGNGRRGWRRRACWAKSEGSAAVWSAGSRARRSVGSLGSRIQRPSLCSLLDVLAEYFRPG